MLGLLSAPWETHVEFSTPSFSLAGRGGSSHLDSDRQKKETIFSLLNEHIKQLKVSPN